MYLYIGLYLHKTEYCCIGQYISTSTGSLSQWDSFCTECFWLIHNNELSKDIYKHTRVCVCVCNLTQPNLTFQKVVHIHDTKAYKEGGGLRYSSTHS